MTALKGAWTGGEPHFFRAFRVSTGKALSPETPSCLAGEGSKLELHMAQEASGQPADCMFP